MSILKYACETFECNDKHFRGIKIEKGTYIELYTKWYDYILKKNDIVIDNIGKKYRIVNVTQGTQNIRIMIYEMIEVEVME